MTQSNRQDEDGELQPLLRRFDEEFGPRRQDEPAPVYGEARPIPQQSSYSLRVPLGSPRIVWVLLALNIAIFVVPNLLQLMGVRVNGVPINDFVLNLGAKNNLAIKRGGEYYRLLTSMFLHVDLFHIAVNSYSLYAIGPETERIYVTPRFLALYFISGLAGGIASYALNPYPGVGASGAIFGLVGGLAVFYYISRKLFGEMSRQQLGSLITVIMINLFIGFSARGIDNFAHIGGLVGGALVGWLLAPRFELDQLLYPPRIARRSLPLAWAGALVFLALLVFLAITI